MKKCFKCQIEKPIECFYKHKAMKDGYFNKCKECTKSDVKIHRNRNIDKIREYDRSRGNRQSKEYIKEYRKKYANKYNATIGIAKEKKEPMYFASIKKYFNDLSPQ